jgi:cation transport ATPase
MVDEAKSTKPKIQEIAGRVASIFAPIILVIAIPIFVAVGIAARHESAMNASIVAMTYAISSLIILCYRPSRANGSCYRGRCYSETWSNIQICRDN